MKTRRFPGFPVLIVVAVGLSTACGATPEPVPAPTTVTQHTIEEFLESTSYVGASFSSDNGRLLVGSNASGIFNVYDVTLDGGELSPLTSSAGDSIFPVGFFPNDDRFLYRSDQGGNELRHLYVQDEDGTVTDLTPGEGFQATFRGWAQDDASFFVQSNERDQRFFDLYEFEVDGYDRQLVYQNDEGYSLGSIADDGRAVVLMREYSTLNTDLFLWRRATGAVTPLTPHEGNVFYRSADFSPDGEWLYYLTDADSEFMYLKRYGLATERHETVLEVDWDILYAYFSWTGRYLVVGVNNDARTELRVYDPVSMTPVELPALPDASVTSVSFSRDETLMAFYAGSSRSPSDLFLYEMAGREPQRLTRSLNAAIDADTLVEGEVVRFTSYDGVEVPGILYKPHQASAANKVPALVWVHGGPGGQSRLNYNGQLQFYLNHGYAVYAINNRGSSGYGKTFFAMDDRKHGDADLDDCVASKQMLIETGWVDPERIGILGGSYGGYMTLAALTFRPEAFAVGVDLFGISNWYRTVNSIPPWWTSQRDALEQEMGDFDDEEFFKAKSPLFHAERIVRPLIVLQGANDPRVLQVESDQIVEAVRANGVPVDYVLFDDEGHGFVKKENQAESARRVLAFLGEHL